MSRSNRKAIRLVFIDRLNRLARPTDRDEKLCGRSRRPRVQWNLQTSLQLDLSNRAFDGGVEPRVSEPSRAVGKLRRKDEPAWSYRKVGRLRYQVIDEHSVC